MTGSLTSLADRRSNLERRIVRLCARRTEIASELRELGDDDGAKRIEVCGEVEIAEMRRTLDLFDRESAQLRGEMGRHP